MRDLELKQKRVHNNGVFGVQNGVADDFIGCDVVNSGADANEDFGVEYEVVGENIGQDVVNSGVEGNFEVGIGSNDLCVDQVESLGEDRNQMIERVGEIEGGDVVVDAEFGNHLKGVLKKNDIIHFKVNEKDKWRVATILGRAEKSTGKHKLKLKLGMTQSQVDPTLYYLEEQGHVIGALVAHIDDSMHCGEDSLIRRLWINLGRNLLQGKWKKGSSNMLGLTIMQNPDGVLLDQGQYLQKLESIVIKPHRAKQKKKPLD